MSDLAQVNIVPFDGFSFSDSKLNDLCLRTLTSNQRILISPAAANPDINAATLSVGANAVDVTGNLTTVGRMKASDMETLAIHLKKAAPTATSGVGPASYNVPQEPPRLRVVGNTPGTSTIDVNTCDVFIVRELSAGDDTGTTYDLLSGANINGRRLTVKNTTAASTITVRVLGSDGTSLIRTVNLAPGAEANFYGFLDVWN